MSGPAEDAESQWRTTRTHSPQSMMDVYRELVFAGFPAARVNAATGAPVYLPEPLVRGVFEGYGTVVAFHYDERRGIGRITFESGDAAEECYLGLQYTYLPLASLFGQHLGEAVDPAGLQFAVLYIEFAEYLPFANTWLVREDLVGQGGSVSRQLLRTFPRRRRYCCTGMGDETKLGALLDGVDVEQLLAAHPTESPPPREAPAWRQQAWYWLRFQLPRSIDAAKPTALRSVNGAFPTITADTRLSAMDLWHSYFHVFVDTTCLPCHVRIPLPTASPAPTSPETRLKARLTLYDQVVEAASSGVLHLVDPLELVSEDAMCVTSDAKLYPAIAAALQSRAKSKVNAAVPLPRRVAFRKLMESASRFASSSGSTVPFSGRQQKEAATERHRAATDALQRASQDDIGTAWQFVLAFLSFKVHADMEPGRAEALSALLPLPPATPADRVTTAVGQRWESDVVTSALAEVRDALRSSTTTSASAAGPPKNSDPPFTAWATRKGEAIVAAPLLETSLPAMALSLLARSGELDTAAGAIQMIDRHAASGSGAALWELCAPLLAEEIQERSARATKRWRLVRELSRSLLATFRVPLLCFAGVLALLLYLAFASPGARRPRHGM